MGRSLRQSVAGSGLLLLLAPRPPRQGGSLPLLAIESSLRERGRKGGRKGGREGGREVSALIIHHLG